MALFEVADNPAAKHKLYGSFPSVTEVLKVLASDGFEKWKRIPGNAEKLESASAFGTKVHALASDMACGRKVRVTEELEPYHAAIEQFLSEHVGKVLGTEMELVSINHRLGGTCDLYAITADGRRAVIDYKTTSSLTRMHGLQLSGYALLLRDNGFGLSRRLCVRIKKEKPGFYATRDFHDEMADSEAFQNALKIWHWKYGPRLAKENPVYDRNVYRAEHVEERKAEKQARMLRAAQEARKGAKGCQ